MLQGSVVGVRSCHDTALCALALEGESSMEAIYFTLVAILLYLVADRALRGIESAAGRSLEYRSVVFFAILLTLAIATFALIRRLGF